MDLFGNAFRDYLQGDIHAEIEVDIGSDPQDALPVAYFFRSLADMPVWEQRAMEESFGKVLDVGAGAGAHSLVLQKKGLEVTALELSAGAIEVMRQRGIKQTVCSDFMQYRAQHFDTLLFLMNGIGMARTLNGLVHLLRHAGSMLTTTGQILLESTDLIYMYEEEDGSLLIPAGSHYYGEITYRLGYKSRKARPFAWLFVDMDNLQHAAGKAGLQTEILWQGEQHNYLARLTRKAE